MNKRKLRLMSIFDDSDNSTEADPYQDDDGEYDSDKDFDPAENTSGSESSYSIISRQKSSNTTAKGQLNLVSTSTQKLVTFEPSSDQDDTRSVDSDHSLPVNLPSPQATSSRFQEEGNDSSSSEDIFPLAKRLKLVKSSINILPTLNQSSNEVTIPESETIVPHRYVTSLTNLDDHPSHNNSQNTTLGLSTLSLISNVLAENCDNTGEFRLDNLPPLFNESQNELALDNLTSVVAESSQNEIVQGEQTCPNQPSNNLQEITTPIIEDWTASIAPIPEFNFDTDTVGVKFTIDNSTTVLDVFNHLFPPLILDYLIECTNAYGTNMCQTNRPKTRHSRSYTFKLTDRNEMLQFLGLCLLGGQVSIPTKRKLFTLSDSLYYHPVFVSTMSGRRYEQLLRCLCPGPLGAKGKYKIMEFMDAITRNFRACYSPDKELSLDESLLLFRGRLSFRQYIKSKKAKYGIKFYELTETNGYVLNIVMYAGKDDSTDSEQVNKTDKIVMRLMRSYVLKGHELFMDNYYNSYGLSQKLLDLKTHTVGTLRPNRKENPKNLMNQKLNKGEHVWLRKNNVYVSKWVDKRAVTMITTKDHPKMINVANKRGQLRRKPIEVVTYNAFMSGIDRADQMVSYYSSPRKCLRWYKKVFFHLLDISVWNSFYLYRKYKMNNSKKYEFLHFREDLIRNLIGISHSQRPELLVKHSKNDNRRINRRVYPEPASTQPDNYSSSGHWPEKIPLPPGSKKTTNYLKCKMCANNKRRKETSLRCKGCKDKPALCALCFEEWHKTLLVPSC